MDIKFTKNGTKCVCPFDADHVPPQMVIQHFRDNFEQISVVEEVPDTEINLSMKFRFEHYGCYELQDQS